MLQLTEQRPSEAAPVEFLIAFVRSLIRIHPSSDALALAMRSALGQVPMTDQQVKKFIKAVSAETEQSGWPKGFFG
jgi:hypothetical protein